MKSCRVTLIMLKSRTIWKTRFLRHCLMLMRLWTYFLMMSSSTFLTKVKKSQQKSRSNRKYQLKQKRRLMVRGKTLGLLRSEQVFYISVSRTLIKSIQCISTPSNGSKDCSPPEWGNQNKLKMLMRGLNHWMISLLFHFIRMFADHFLKSISCCFHSCFVWRSL